MRCAWQMLDSDPKNQLVINPCFRVQFNLLEPTFGTDAQQLTDDLAAVLTTWAGTADLTVRAYNMQGSKPNYLRGHGVAWAQGQRGSHDEGGGPGAGVRGARRDQRRLDRVEP